MGKHYAKLTGQRLRKIYKFGRDRLFLPSKVAKMIYEEKEFIEEFVVYEGEVDNPRMSQGEVIYVGSLDKSFEIVSVVKNSDGGYIYYTTHKEIIEDEKTEESYKSAKEQELTSLREKNVALERNIENLYDQLRNVEKLNEQLKDIENRSLWARVFNK